MSASKLNKIQTAQIIKTTDVFERVLSKENEQLYVLRLYVSGLTPNSRRAIDNTKQICESSLKGHYELDIIDIYQQPARAREDQIVAVPTLVKVSPVPIRKFIGDMSNVERIILGLNLGQRS